jgi:hypothetical protein
LLFELGALLRCDERWKRHEDALLFNLALTVKREDITEELPDWRV